MKEQVQQTGVRKWYGDDWIDIQNELMAVMEAHFGQFDKQFIFSGCQVTGTTVSAGIVVLNTDDGYKLYRFPGATGISFPQYFMPEIVEDNRVYLDGDVKPVAKSYNAALSTTDDGGYLQLKSDNSTVRFTDIIQDATHRMVSDAEKQNWNGSVESAVSTVRGGITSTLNTLEKLKTYLVAQIEAVDTGEVDLQPVYDYIDSLAYFPEFVGSETLVGSNIDFSGKPIQRKTLTADTVLTASNLIENKSMTLIVSGDFNLDLSAAYFNKISGDYDGTVKNVIQFLCTNSATGSEEIWYSINQKALV